MYGGQSKHMCCTVCSTPARATKLRAVRAQPLPKLPVLQIVLVLWLPSATPCAAARGIAAMPSDYSGKT
jgi:hypothetical protein